METVGLSQMQGIYLPQSPHLKSPEEGSLNVCLLIPVLKSKVGRSDDVQILNCLNIKSPDRRGLQRKPNRLSDMMVDVTTR